MDSMVSVIMASYLGQYDGCALDREIKFVRAVYSFLDNSNYSEKELIIVSDGCYRTNEIYELLFSNYDNIKLIMLEKQPLFSGNVRQAGVEASSGDIITFLDTDDVIGTKHIKYIAYYMSAHNFDWCYYDATLGYGKKNFGVSESKLIGGHCGTSSISYKKSLGVSWKNHDGAGHDWHFIIGLMRASKNYSKIQINSYHICHINGKFDI